jgi:hypothetical protein
MIGQRPFSVYGYLPHSSERYGEVYEATSARAAEDLARMAVIEAGARFHVAGVLEGKVLAVDAYTKYVDPRDVRNADAEDLIPDCDELEVAQWTVLGLIIDRADPRWNERTGGQRYCQHIWALSPLAAEDVAQDMVRDQSGTSALLVCAVFPGVMQRADALYAQFSDPDVPSVQ